MTIAIQLDPAFDVETFDGLVAYIIAHLELDAESALQVPTFIRKGEYRLDRLLTVPQRESSVTLTTTAGRQDVALPADCRSVMNVQTDRTLKQVSIATLDDCYTEETGSPDFYAVSEQALWVGPVPNSPVSLDVTYLTKLPAISSENQTNWLLANNADAYIYSALWQACAWREDIDAATAFRAELMSIIREVNLQAQQYRFSAPLVPNLAVA